MICYLTVLKHTMCRKQEESAGRLEGENKKLVQIICKKLKKNKGVREIADALEEDECVIQEIVDVAVKYAPDYDVDRIMEEMR